MDLIAFAKAKKYTDDSLGGVDGILKGKNCTIKSIEKIDGVNTVTFQWTADDGTVKTSTMQVADGIAGVGTDGKSAYQVWLDLGNTGTEEDFLNSLKGEKGADGTMTFEDLTDEQKEYLKGEDGFSPAITENADNSDEVYKLDIETKDGVITTPNLKGSGATIDDNVVSPDTVWSSVKVRNELMDLEANMQQFFIVTGEYSVDDDDNWIVSNVDKTFTEIDEALTNNQDVVLKIYPEGTSENPYILYPSMHYANMGIAFSLMVPDTGQISGF